MAAQHVNVSMSSLLMISTSSDLPIGLEGRHEQLMSETPSTKAIRLLTQVAQLLGEAPSQSPALVDLKISKCSSTIEYDIFHLFS
jgi:hypothetical protein